MKPFGSLRSTRPAAAGSEPAIVSRAPTGPPPPAAASPNDLEWQLEKESNITKVSGLFYQCFWTFLEEKVSGLF